MANTRQYRPSSVSMYGPGKCFNGNLFLKTIPSTIFHLFMRLKLPPRATTNSASQYEVSVRVPLFLLASKFPIKIWDKGSFFLSLSLSLSRFLTTYSNGLHFQNENTFWNIEVALRPILVQHVVPKLVWTRQIWLLKELDSNLEGLISRIQKEQPKRVVPWRVSGTSGYECIWQLFRLRTRTILDLHQARDLNS